MAVEPKIDEKRKDFLRAQCEVVPDIERGIYPFRTAEGSIKLHREDIEWLLYEHGHIEWSNPEQRDKVGLDLRGADLSEESLCGLPLARILAGVWENVSEEQQRLGAVNLSNADLRHVHLEGATLVHANLQGANLAEAHLEGADCRAADLSYVKLRHAHLGGMTLQHAKLKRAQLMHVHLERANLRSADLAGANLHLTTMDRLTRLDDVTLAHKDGLAAEVADTRWGDVNLAVVKWDNVKQLGDERIARKLQEPNTEERETVIEGAESQTSRYADAIRANRQLATVLRSQGLNDIADHFAYRSLVLRRDQSQFFRAIGSWILCAISGYGYKPWRSALTYLGIVGGFSCIYWLLRESVHPALNPIDVIVFSITSFHGRGFSPGEAVTLHNPLTIVAALEAIVGLLIEITFIATFTQRFFAR